MIEVGAEQQTQMEWVVEGAEIAPRKLEKAQLQKMNVHFCA